MNSMSRLAVPLCPLRIRKAVWAAGVAVLLVIHPVTAQCLPSLPDLELGKRLYRQGILASGEPLRATVQGDVSMAGPHLACATCHGRSGFGSREGAAPVPPITGPTLYQATVPVPVTPFRTLYQDVQPPQVRTQVRALRLRPAYTEATLAVALRQGQDPAGRPLAPLMPRYTLSDADLHNLSAYLHTLSAQPAPGVTASTIHFATVITDAVPAAERQTMLAVLDAYVRWKNADTARRLQRPRTGVWYEDAFPEAYRTWELHVWELYGPSDTWRRQLDAFYAQQPVFALLSGMGAGSWQPVHDFCEAAEVPCLFPHTDLPVVEPPGAYMLYLSPGLSGEAQALAQYLRTTVASAQIVQVYRDNEASRTPAYALRQALPPSHQISLHDEMLTAPPTAAFWQTLWRTTAPAILVLWLNAADVATLTLAPDTLNAVSQIYLSSRLVQATLTDLPQSLRDKVYLTYPFALPQEDSPHGYRLRAWLRSRGVARADERLQFNTYLTLSLTDYVLMHLRDQFVRDYFIETIEHETESMPNPGAFPQLSLGPGQRFASTGSYIVRPVLEGIQAVSEWIVP